MKKIRISELPLSESTKGLYLLATDSENKSVKVSMDSMSEERAAADAELLKRIIGKSTSSSAYTDPFKYLDNFASEKDENGTITKHAIRVMQDALLETLRHSDYRDSFPYIGHMRAHVEGVPIEVWNYVKAWNTASTNGVFVQVVRTNFGLNNGVISSALTESFHEYFRTVTVGMANGSVTDVTATEWKESTLRDTDRQNIASIAFLGDFNNINEAAAQAATVQYAGNADYVLLRFRIGGKGGLILQNVNGNSTEQYLFNDGKRYVRYVDFTSADRTAVKNVQTWKLDGVAYIFYDSAKRIIYQRNQWDENISGGGPSTLPLVSSQYAGLLSNTAFTHLSNFNIYEHSVPTTTSVRLVFTNPITGTATNVTLAAVTSARAGVMTVALYNELQQATAGVATEAAARKASDAELQAKIQNHEDRIWKLENQWYGIEWDTEVSSPAVKRIGNMDLHRTLPIQSRMRGCLLNDNGKVTKYLNPKDWTGEVRDGSRGQVMVEIPMHYRRCETEGTKRRVKISEYPLPGFLPIPKMYPAAYEASIERSTGKLCSVVNEATDYRGGNNNANYDGTYRSFLGRPVTAISRTAFRTAARKRKSGSTEWNCYTYDIHKTLFWLFVVEYATLNSQAGYNSEPTSEGYRQGGLGAGVTTWDSNWSTFNGYYPFVPCGHTDSLGNRTGVVSYTAKNDDESITKTFDVPRYRGVENPFGHIWKWTDGCNIQVSATQENGGTGLSKAFICHDPANFQDSNYANYSHVGNIDRSGGYVKEVLFGVGGEILPKTTGGGSTTYFCDNHYTNIPTSGEALRGLLFGGVANGGAGAGLACAYSDRAPSNAAANVGSRLCFIPSEA